MTRTCKGCGETKDLSTGYYNGRDRCKECCKARSRQNHRARRQRRYCPTCSVELPFIEGQGRAINYCSAECKPRPIVKSSKDRFRQYGITAADYESMRARQGDRCAICQTSDPGSRSGAWHIDHCHDTGAVRGLLCVRCNIGLGQFRDSPWLLSAAIEYLLIASQPAEAVA